MRRRPAASHLFPGAAPGWPIVPTTSPRFPAYETPGGHESKALQVAWSPAFFSLRCSGARHV